MSNDGKYLEKIVHLIEQSLSPDDTVEYNVNLPILTSIGGYKTQCDIVIRKGKLPRQTLIIVEVQDRNSKVKPNDFRGWEMKMEEVGAQHLIAVSKQEFPSSIKEKAKISGNKIYLMNIKNVIPQEIPNFINIKFEDRKFNILEINDFQPIFSRSKAELLGISIESIYKKIHFSSQEKIWSFDKKNLLSFYDIVFSIQKDIGNLLDKGISKLEFDLEHNKIFMVIDNNFLPLKLYCEYTWEYKIKEIPAKIFSYEQIDNGTLGWLVEFDYEDEKGNTNIKVPIIKKDNGYTISSKRINIEGIIPSELSLYHFQNN